jgi:hypothetical protein
MEEWKSSWPLSRTDLYKPLEHTNTETTAITAVLESLSPGEVALYHPKTKATYKAVGGPTYKHAIFNAIEAQAIGIASDPKQYYCTNYWLIALVEPCVM